jgi:hypothetical protein
LSFASGGDAQIVNAAVYNKRHLLVAIFTFSAGDETNMFHLDSAGDAMEELSEKGGTFEDDVDENALEISSSRIVVKNLQCPALEQEV